MGGEEAKWNNFDRSVNAWTDEYLHLDAGLLLFDFTGNIMVSLPKKREFYLKGKIESSIILSAIYSCRMQSAVVERGLNKLNGTSTCLLAGECELVKVSHHPISSFST